VFEVIDFLTDSTDPDLDPAFGVLEPDLSDSSELFDLADWDLELSFDLVLVEVPGLEFFSGSSSEFLELADAVLELASDSEPDLELALESFLDFPELERESLPDFAELTLESLSEPVFDAFPEFADVGLEYFSRLAELLRDLFPDFEEPGLVSFPDFSELTEFFLEFSFDITIVAVPGRESFSILDFKAAEFGLEPAPDPSLDFAELALEDFTEVLLELAASGIELPSTASFDTADVSLEVLSELMESFLSVLVELLLFAVPGRESFSDSSSRKPGCVLV
jgi:hypothetical protein